MCYTSIEATDILLASTQSTPVSGATVIQGISLIYVKKDVGDTDGNACQTG